MKALTRSRGRAQFTLKVSVQLIVVSVLDILFKVS